MQHPSSGRLSALLSFLLLLNVSFCGLIWIAATIEVPTESIAPVPVIGGLASPMVAALPTVPQAKQLTETLSRPLFRTDRRPVQDRTPSNVERIQPLPPQPVAVAAPPTPIPPKDLRLVGIVSLPGRGFRALLRSDASESGASHVAGDIVAGWRLIEVRADAIVAEAAGLRREFGLFGPAKSQAERQP